MSYESAIAKAKSAGTHALDARSSMLGPDGDLAYAICYLAEAVEQLARAMKETDDLVRSPRV